MGAMLKRLFGSRKWIVAMSGIIVCTGVIVAGWDETAAQAMADKIVNVVLILSGLYIGGTAIEDAALKIGVGKSE